MSEAGQLFVIDGDLTKVDCDAVLIPTDSELRVERPWAHLLGVEIGNLDHKRFPAGSRVQKYSPTPKIERPEGPAIWLGDIGSDAPDVDWYADGLTEFVREASASLRRGRRRRPPRIAVNVVGTGRGGSRHDKGTIYNTIVKALNDAARGFSVDVVLVCWGPRQYSAAQRARQKLKPSPEVKLPSPMMKTAEELAGFVRSDNLVLFVGAGVSMGAGLLSWDGLIESLRQRSPGPTINKQQFAKLDPRDQAEILATRFGKRAYRKEVKNLLESSDRYALAHGLLASLHTRENVTTNYDLLFETALRTGGRRCSVLPRQPAKESDPWLLKLHGSLDNLNKLVLTRGEYLGLPEQSGALFGIMQAMLMTKHMLFVGYSLQDDSFHRVMHEVRRARPRRRGQKLGTALMLENDPLLEEMWREDLNIVTMEGWPGDKSELPTSGPERIAVLARRLDRVLGEVGFRSADVSSFLLDPTYREMLTKDEKDVHVLLQSVVSKTRRTESPTLRHVDQLLRGLGSKPK